MKTKLGWQSKQVTELRAEVKRLMFTSDKNPVVMTQETSKFSQMMLAFSNYEKAVVS